MVLRTSIEKSMGGKQLKIFWTDFAKKIDYKSGIWTMREGEYGWVYLPMEEEMNSVDVCIS